MTAETKIPGKWNGAWFKNMPGTHPNNLSTVVQMIMCGHGYNCDPSQAKLVARKLTQQAYAAVAAGKKSAIWFDQPSQKWYGRETPPERESLGLVRKSRRGKQSSHETYRVQLQGQIFQTKDRVAAMQRIFGIADPAEAEKRWDVVRAHDYMTYDSETQTWRHHLMPKPNPADWNRWITPALQAKYDLVADMPELTHKFSEDPAELAESPLLQWLDERTRQIGYTVAGKSITAETPRAVALNILRDQISKCTRVDAIKPWYCVRKNEDGSSVYVGRNNRQTEAPKAETVGESIPAVVAVKGKESKSQSIPPDPESLVIRYDKKRSEWFIGEEKIDLGIIYDEFKIMPKLPESDACKFLCDAVGFEWNAKHALRRVVSVFQENRDGTYQGTSWRE